MKKSRKVDYPKQFWEKKNKAGRLLPPDFDTYYKSTDHDNIVSIKGKTLGQGSGGKGWRTLVPKPLERISGVKPREQSHSKHLEMFFPSRDLPIC